MHLGTHLPHQSCHCLGTGPGEPSDDLRLVVRRPLRATWIDALEREGQVEVVTCDQYILLEHGENDLLRRDRIIGALQDDQLAGSEAALNASACRPNEG